MPRSVGSVLIVAHRGASSGAGDTRPHAGPNVGPHPGPNAGQDLTENTLAAVRRAVAVGADLVEVDVRRSRDGAFVLLHDDTLTRTTMAAARYPERAPWRVADFDLAELRTLGVGTLAEALTTAPLLVELKEPHLDPGVVEHLAEVVAPYQATVQVQSFDVPAMKHLKTLAPDLSVALLGRPPVENLRALATWADGVHPHHWRADASYVSAIRRSGMRCLVWTVNRRRALSRALRLGVDGIITDRPVLLAELVSPVGS